MDIDIELLSRLLRNAQIVSYMNVFSAVLLVYDILITLDEESMSIWSGKMNWSKILYLITRYSTLIEVGVVLWEQIVPGTWYRGCKISFDINVWLFIIGLGIGEVVMSLRTWAVWKRDKNLGRFLMVFWPLCWGGGFAICGVWAKTVKFEPHPVSQLRGCYVTDASSVLFVAWLILLVYNTLNLILICIPAYRSYRLGGNSEFVRTVYTDGIVYYVYLFAISALNIIVVLTLPRDLATLLSMPERVLHAAFTCRVVLHIRQLTRQEQLSTEASSIEFVSNSVDNKSKEIESKSTFSSVFPRRVRRGTVTGGKKPAAEEYSR